MKLNQLAAVALIGMFGANVASATIILDSSNDDCSANVHPSSQGAVVAAFKLACNTGDVTELYKANFGGGDEKSFASSYNTTFFGFKDWPDEDPTKALIQYVAGRPAISGFEKIFVLAKGGNSYPTYYGWDISGWDGTESLLVKGWKDVRGAISNVSIWAGGKRISVPEPGAISLLGLALVGLGFVRRRIVR